MMIVSFLLGQQRAGFALSAWRENGDFGRMLADTAGGHIAGERIVTADGVFVRIGNIFYRLESEDAVIAARDLLPYPRLWLGNDQLVDALGTKNISRHLLEQAAALPAISKRYVSAALSAESSAQRPSRAVLARAAGFLIEFNGKRDSPTEAELMLALHYIAVILRNSEGKGGDLSQAALRKVFLLVRNNNDVLAVKALYLLQLFLEDERLALAQLCVQAETEGKTEEVRSLSRQMKNYGVLINRIIHSQNNKQGYRKYAVKPDGRGGWQVVRLGFPGNWRLKVEGAGRVSRHHKLRVLKSLALVLEGKLPAGDREMLRGADVYVLADPAKYEDMLAKGDYLVRRDVTGDVYFVESLTGEGSGVEKPVVFVRAEFLQQTAEKQKKVIASALKMKAEALRVEEDCEKKNVPAGKTRRPATFFFSDKMSHYGHCLLADELRRRDLTVMDHIPSFSQYTEHFGALVYDSLRRALESEEGAAADGFLPGLGEKWLRRMAQSDIVVISIYDGYLTDKLSLIRNIKARFPQKLVAVGGPSVIKAPEEMALIFAEADIVFRGFDPDVFADIVEDIVIDTDSGKAFLKDQTTVSGARAGVLVDLPAELCVGELGSVNRGKIRLPDYRREEPIDNLVLSRGCTKHCNFCESGQLSGRQVVEVNELLAWLENRDEFLSGRRFSTAESRGSEHSVWLVDDDLLLNGRWGNDLIAALEDERERLECPEPLYLLGIENISVQNLLTAAGEPDTGLIERLKAVGVPEKTLAARHFGDIIPRKYGAYGMGLGIDGLSDQAALALNKGHSFRQGFAVLEALRAAGIGTSFNNILTNPQMSIEGFVECLLNYYILMAFYCYSPRVLNPTVVAYFGSNHANRYIVDNAPLLRWGDGGKTKSAGCDSLFLLELNDNRYVYLEPFELDPAPAIAAILSKYPFEKHFEFETFNESPADIAGKILKIIKAEFLADLPALIRPGDIFYEEKKALYLQLLAARAEELVQQGDLAQAAALYSNYLEFDPDSVEIRERLDLLSAAPLAHGLSAAVAASP